MRDNETYKNAYQSAFSNYMRGDRPTQCPYKHGSIEALAWQEANDDAKQYNKRVAQGVVPHVDSLFKI